MLVKEMSVTIASAKKMTEDCQDSCQHLTGICPDNDRHIGNRFRSRDESRCGLGHHQKDLGALCCCY
jgi:hypothetical protein